DSLWDAFAGNDNLRVPLYLQLKQLDRLDKLSPELRSQAHMTRAQLYAWGVEEGKDSLEFIGKRWLTLKRGSGYVYFYKLKREDEDDWQIDYVGVQPADSARISMQVSLRQKGLDIDPDKTQEAQLDEIMRDLRWSERKRAKQVGTKVDGFDENFWVY
ncbi:MAG: hypothetical protein AAGB22_09860, partial [Bacteroidota bacterium]